MRYNIITTQPSLFESFLKTGLIGRGQEKKIIEIKIYNLYDYAFDKHKSIDDKPYGGGAGMVIKVDVVANAIDHVKRKLANQKNKKIVLLTPQGKKFTQKDAQRLAKEKEIILISGRFEGYDERIRPLCDEEISIGDYVLTSGDLPVMVLIDAISRQIPGFIEKSDSIKDESFNKLKIENCEIENCLEYPQYTRPEEFSGKRVPEILLSGNNEEIDAWRKNQMAERTKSKRPDLN